MAMKAVHKYSQFGDIKPEKYPTASMKIKSGSKRRLTRAKRWLLLPVTPVPEESINASWPPQALHAHAAQTYTQEKLIHVK